MTTLPAASPRFSLPKRAALALGCALFFFYMLLASRERPWADATPLYQVASEIVTHCELDIATRWPPTLRAGVDGKTYGVAPLLQALQHVPGALVQNALTAIADDQRDQWLALGSHIAPAACAAAVLILILDLCRMLGASRLAAGLTVASLAVASTLAVYARYPYSEALQALCFTGFFRAFVRLFSRPTALRAAAFGTWAGALCAAKLIYGPAVLATIALFALWQRHTPRQLARMMAIAAAAAVPWVALVLWYNHRRFGSVFETGVPDLAFLGESTLTGLWGLFLSPGKSVFLYSPLLLVALCGLPHLWRAHRAWFWAMVVTVVPTVLVYARVLFWAGDWAWGPRYMVFLVPVATVPLCLWLDALFASPGLWRFVRLSCAAVVAGAALWVQVLGSALHWDHFICIGINASNEWLGEPKVKLSNWEVEPMFPQHWLPPFQPIAGHAWLLRHVWRKDPWAVAEKDAPWRAFTTLPLHVQRWYDRARLDFWWRDFTGRNRTAGVLVFAALVLGLAGSTYAFARTVRPRRGNS